MPSRRPAAKPRRRPAPDRTARTPPRAARRHRQIRAQFDPNPSGEWRRYGGEARRILVRELRSRFLALHLPSGSGWVLELGPGPGRFTPQILGSGGHVAAVDLSLPMLRSARRRLRGRNGVDRVAWVRGAGERLPFPDRSFRAAVLYGNILGFSAHETSALLAELGRVVALNGRLLLDVASPGGAIQEFFVRGAERRFLRRVLRSPDRYFVRRVLATGHQPYAPGRMANWEFGFHTAPEVGRMLARAGFRVLDRMAVGPIGAFQEAIARAARREPTTWENLLRTEEMVGRRPGVLETGHGFVVAAVRDGRPRPAAAPRRR